MSSAKSKVETTNNSWRAISCDICLRSIILVGPVEELNFCMYCRLRYMHLQYQEEDQSDGRRGLTANELC